MTTLIITEKPSVARRIATILARNVKTRKTGKISYYEFEIDGEKYYSVPAAGHLLELDYPEGEWVYPAIVNPEKLVLKEIEGKRLFLRLIKKLGDQAERIIIATDLDAEGSSIGLEIIRALGWEGKKEILRMEFSSLSPAEIRRAFRELKPFDYPRANAGFTRRVLDLEWGANVSRGLTLSTRRRRWVRILSSGRVQGPTLALIVKREREIRNFVPRKYYEVYAVVETSSGRMEMKLSPPKGEERIWDMSFAERAAKAVRGKWYEVSVRSRRVKLSPPPPFDGTTLQVEGSRITGLTPKQIADRSTGIAQQLYEAGLISYIGTESQKYPKTWTEKDFIKLAELIGAFHPLKEAAEYVLKNPRIPPVQGKKDDPAHPAIHIVGVPEGEFPTKKHREIYELVARRNLATMAPDAIVRRVTASFSEEDFIFKVTGSALEEEGWLKVYPYAKKDYSLPPVEDGEVVKVVDVRVEEKETQPPKRYTPVSIIKEMEKLGLGTKNTRVQILDILKERGYIEGKSFRPTPLGEAVVEVLENYVPDLTSPQLTARLEEAMRSIEMGELDHNTFLERTLKDLEGIMKRFKEYEQKISERLALALDEHRRNSDVVGKCVKCGTGDLLLKKSKYGLFIVCSNAPGGCDAKYNLMKGEKVSSESCACGLPLVEGSVKTRAGKRLKYVRCLGNCQESPLRCSKCGGVMRAKESRFGVYVQCVNCGTVNFFRVSRRR